MGQERCSVAQIGVTASLEASSDKGELNVRAQGEEGSDASSGGLECTDYLVVHTTALSSCFLL